MTQAPEPGWYPDPEDSALARYWDGYRWTEQRRQFPQGPLGAGAHGAALDTYAPATGGAVALPPPRRGMSTGVKVLLGILAGFAILAVLVIGGCVACGALVFTAVDDELTDTDYGTVALGQPIEIRGVRYTATNVETPTRSGPRSEPRTGALIVTLDVEKPGGAPGALSRNQLLLETDAGRQIPIDDAAQDQLARALPFQPLEAGTRVSGRVVFQVLPGEVPSARLRIDAVLGNGHGNIDLER